MIYETLQVVIPEDFVIVKMSMKEFRRFLKGVWNDSLIFETKEELVCFDLEHRRVLIGIKAIKK